MNETCKFVSRKPTEGNFADGVGGKAVLFGEGNPQEITGQRERYDLTASIGQQLVQTNNTSRKPECALRRFTFRKYRRSGPEVDWIREPFELAKALTSGNSPQHRVVKRA
jgi:hypothetical protein